MRYEVIIERAAIEDVADAYVWLAARNPQAAERWLVGFAAVRDSLAGLPRRWPLARRGSAAGPELRRAIYGRGRNKYCVMFTIDGPTVRILSVRHAARREGRR